MGNKLQPLTTYLVERGYTLQRFGDCYGITSPKGKKKLANIRRKSKPVWGLVAKRWEWSIPLTSWQRYIASGITVFMVLETATGKVHAADITQLQPEARTYRGDDLDEGGTVFLPIDAYKIVATLKR